MEQMDFWNHDTVHEDWNLIDISKYDVGAHKLELACACQPHVLDATNLSGTQCPIPVEAQAAVNGQVYSDDCGHKYLELSVDHSFCRLVPHFSYLILQANYTLDVFIPESY